MLVAFFRSGRDQAFTLPGETLSFVAAMAGGSIRRAPLAPKLGVVPNLSSCPSSR